MSQSAFWTLPQALAWILRRDLEVVRWLATADDVGPLHHMLEQWDPRVDPPVERDLSKNKPSSDTDIAYVSAFMGEPVRPAALPTEEEERRRRIVENRKRAEREAPIVSKGAELVTVHGRLIGEEIEAAICGLVEAARSGEVPAIDRTTGKPVEIPPAAANRQPIGYDPFWKSVSFPSAAVTAKYKPGRSKVGQIAIHLTAWLKQHPGSTKGEARDWFDSNFKGHPVHQFSKAWGQAPPHLKRSRGKRGPSKNSK